LDGRPLDLSSYRGKVVLLDFGATWCTPCRGEIPHFVDLQDKYRDQGLQVIGIPMDDGVKPVRRVLPAIQDELPGRSGK
jgi:thiol-disulfide isomerase/thioredoxin